MKFVTKNKVIIAILLTIIFVILFYHSFIVKYIHKYINEPFTIDNDRLGIFVINMNKDKERYEKLIKYYLRSDFPNNKLNRFSGIVGKEVNNKQWLTNDAISELQLLEKNGYRTHHHHLTRGAIGCFLSHYYLAKKLLTDKNADYYIIFEDDTMIFPNTFYRINKSIETAPKDWDMILFYSIRSLGRRLDNTFNRIKSFWGMNCYIMNKSGAEKFVKEVNENKIDGQVDCYLSRMVQQDKINIYATRRQFVSSNSTDTNIQAILKPKKGIDPYDYKGYKI